LPSAGANSQKRISRNTRIKLEKVGYFVFHYFFHFFLIINFIDKERYEKELRSLESYSEKLKKPKKCLSAYMIFVKEVSYTILTLVKELFRDSLIYSDFLFRKPFSLIK
jgi:hypothetical protein